MSHTPGPWRLRLHGVGAGRVGSVNGASIVAVNDVRVVSMPRIADRPYNDKVSDAALIAAAPDLLEALKHSQCPHCEVIFGQHPDHYELYPCSTCEPWRALIAKAEGT